MLQFDGKKTPDSQTVRDDKCLGRNEYRVHSRFPFLSLGVSLSGFNYQGLLYLSTFSNAKTPLHCPESLEVHFLYCAGKKRIWIWTWCYFQET